MTRISIFVSVLVVAAFLCVIPAFGQDTQERFALVIGNSNYRGFGKLNNPGNDALDMAETLKGLGFSVTLLKDADLRGMEQGIVWLGNALSTSESAVGFFFYAGHGVQSRGMNYLIPVDAEIPSEAFLSTKAVAVQVLLDTLLQAGNKVNVIVLDACRDNPFSWSRSGTRGLTVVSAQPPGSIIAYATSAGSVAADGTGRNGFFTGELLKNLKKPDLSIFDMFQQTGADVKASTNGAQIPAIYSQFFDKLYLAKPQSSGSPIVPLNGARLDQYVALLANAREAEGRNAWGSALNAYTSAIAAVPGGEIAALGLARCYGKLGSKTKADALFREILKQDAVLSAWDYGDMADFYLNAMQDPDTAIALYSKALAGIGMFEGNGWHYYGRGMAFKAKGDTAKARADLERGLAMGEELSDADLVSSCKQELAAPGR
jgi:uncharacterized caspase-like protein